MAADTFLCVMSDDFGMHPAINAGIARAYTDGVLTDTNLMPVCPAFEEAAELARELHIPGGLHAALTCDWDLYRWGPLTEGKTLVNEDGWLRDSVGRAWRGASDEDAVAEFLAQYEAILIQNLAIEHFSYHMGTDRKGRLFRALASLGSERVRPLRLPDPDNHWLPYYTFDSAFSISTRGLDLKRRKSYLITMLRQLEPGYHMWVVHAAEDDPALEAMSTPSFHAARWTRAYRALDMALLVDNEVKDLIAELRIELVSASRCPVALPEPLPDDDL